MRRKNLDQTAFLHKLPPKLPLNVPSPARNRLLRESSPFPFQTNQCTKDAKKKEHKLEPRQPLINISKNQKRAIIRPDGSKIVPKRIHAPFATDTPPIKSARRNVNKKSQFSKDKIKSNLSHVIKNLLQSENCEANSPRRLNDQSINYQKSFNKDMSVYQEVRNEPYISSLPNKNFTIIQQTDFANIDLPLLPSSQNRFQQSNFPKRVSQIEAIVKEHRKTLNKLIDIIESRVSQNTNESFDMINELVEKPLNSLLPSKIQSILSSLFEKNSIFEKQITNLDQTLQKDYHQTNESLNEQKMMISQFINSMNTFETSNILGNSLNEVSRLNDKIAFTISDKLKSVENDEVLKSATTLHLKDNLEILKTSFSDKIDSTVAQVNFMIDSEYQKYSDLIQSEISDKNQKIFDHLSSKIQALSNSFNSTFSDYKEAIDQSSESMKLSIEESEKSFHETIAELTNGKEKEIEERLSAAIENSQKNFEILRNETKTTTDEIYNKAIIENNELLAKIENEYQTIKDNTADAQKKFDNFISLIENERKFQICHFFDVNKPSEFPQNEKNQSVFKMDVKKMIRNELAPEMALLTYHMECVNSAENRLAHLESFLENTKNQFDAHFISISSDLDEATQKVNDLKMILNGDDRNDSSSKSLRRIENMIDEIEKRPKNELNLAQKAELKALEQITQRALEEKVTIISEKIGEINRQIDLIKSGKNDGGEFEFKTRYRSSPKHVENSPNSDADDDCDYDSYSDESAF